MAISLSSFLVSCVSDLNGPVLFCFAAFCVLMLSAHRPKSIPPFVVVSSSALVVWQWMERGCIGMLKAAIANSADIYSIAGLRGEYLLDQLSSQSFVINRSCCAL